MSGYLRSFILSAAVILCVTAAAKIVSVFSTAPLMLLPDPLVGIPFRYLLLLAAIAELVTAGLCFFAGNSRRKIIALAWLSSAFLIYRTGLWFIGWHRPCHCLGDLTEPLHLPAVWADDLMKMVLLYLLIGSYASLIWIWRSEARQATCVP